MAFLEVLRRLYAKSCMMKVESCLIDSNVSEKCRQLFLFEIGANKRRKLSGVD